MKKLTAFCILHILYCFDYNLSQHEFKPKKTNSNIITLGVMEIDDLETTGYIDETTLQVLREPGSIVCRVYEISIK